MRRLHDFIAAWRLALRIMRLNWWAAIEYRGEFLTSICLGIAWEASVIVFVAVLLNRFAGIGGWPSRAVFLIVAMRMLSHGLYALIFDRQFQLSTIVQEGRLDAFLLRPMPVYRQVLLSALPTNAFGDLLVGISMCVLAIARADLTWTITRVLYLGLAVVGCTLMEAAVFTALSGLQLEFPSASAWSIWMEELIGIFGSYPLSFLPRVMSYGLTYVVPVAFMAYLPVGALTGRTASLGVPVSLALFSPLLGLVAYVVSRVVWKWHLGRYTGVNG